MKIRFGTKLLSLKMTLQFILFGLLIGYFSLILNMVVAGRQVFDRFSREFQQISEIGEEGSDWIFQNFILNPEKGEALLESILVMIPAEDRDNVSLALFMKSSDTGESWEKIADAGGGQEEGESRIPLLEKALELGVYNKSGFYVGQARKQVFLLDITPEESSRAYVLSVDFLQESLREFVRYHRDYLLPYTLVLVILSFLLAVLFTHNVARTIRSLTDKALQVARGEENVSFRNRRLDDIGILSHALDRMAHNLRHRARTMGTMNRIDRAVLSSLSRGELLSRVISFIGEQFSDAGVAVLEREGDHFIVLALCRRGDGSDGTPLIGERLEWPFDKDGADLTGIDLSDHSSFRSLFDEKGMGRQTVAYPLVLDEESLGYIVITRNKLDDQERETLRMLADQTGVALKSLNEYRSREKLNEGMLLALTKTVDAKSRWTAGHSERVTELALSLSLKADPTGSLRDRVRIAGHLHDIGKLAIPEAILDKPGRLEPREFELIKSHPLRGYEILGEIPGFDEVRQAIKSHHERWDGTGYPDGLAGEAIPRIARIITICDVYDAITEDRPYRKGFTPEETGRFLLSERGKLFDPDLLDLFLELKGFCPPGS
jgi:HD-GYP domain-containing protein (c-di-GMP phosphodiesterase class II)